MIGNFITSVLLLILSGVIYAESSKMPNLGGMTLAGPGFFPKCCAAFFTFAAVVLIIQEVYKIITVKTGDTAYAKAELKKAADLKETIKNNLSGVFRMTVIPVLMVLYGISLRGIGFEISTFVFLIASMAVCGERSWKRLLLIPIAAIIVVYLLFIKFLRVAIPTSFL